MTTPNEKPAVETPLAPKPTKPATVLAIDHIEVFRFAQGTDRVTIYTDLPEATLPDDRQKLTLEFRAARGTGEAYCKKYFPTVPIELKEFT